MAPGGGPEEHYSSPLEIIAFRNLVASSSKRKFSESTRQEVRHYPHSHITKGRILSLNYELSKEGFNRTIHGLMALSQGR